jgi:hypothetical protein
MKGSAGIDSDPSSGALALPSTDAAAVPGPVSFEVGGFAVSCPGTGNFFVPTEGREIERRARSFRLKRRAN